MTMLSSSNSTLAIKRLALLMIMMYCIISNLLLKMPRLQPTLRHPIYPRARLVIIIPSRTNASNHKRDGMLSHKRTYNIQRSHLQIIQSSRTLKVDLRVVPRNVYNASNRPIQHTRLLLRLRQNVSLVTVRQNRVMLQRHISVRITVQISRYLIMITPRMQHVRACQRINLHHLRRHNASTSRPLICTTKTTMKIRNNNLHITRHRINASHLAAIVQMTRIKM